VTRTLRVEGKALKPRAGLTPIKVLDASNDAMITWTRRSRIGSDGAAAGANIVGEIELRFEVDLIHSQIGIVSTTKTSVGTEKLVNGTLSLAAATPTASEARITGTLEDFTAAGFEVGKLARLEAFTHPANRGTFEINAVGTTTIDIEHPTAVTQSPAVASCIVRQLVEQVRFTAAEQVAAGYTAGNPLLVRIYQISATVGRGFVLETTI
jgi:hypothetical protein